MDWEHVLWLLYGVLLSYLPRLAKHVPQVIALFSIVQSFLKVKLELYDLARPEDRFALPVALAIPKKMLSLHPELIYERLRCGRAEPLKYAAQIFLDGGAYALAIRWWSLRPLPIPCTAEELADFRKTFTPAMNEAEKNDPPYCYYI